MLREEENNLEETSSEHSDEDDEKEEQKAQPTKSVAAKPHSMRTEPSTLETSKTAKSAMTQSSKAPARKDDTKLPSLTNKSSLNASGSRPMESARNRQKSLQGVGGSLVNKFNSSTEVTLSH